MKKTIFLFVMVCFVCTSASLHAGQDYPLGHNSVDVKVHHFEFTDDVFGDADLDNGWYVGLEGSFALMPNLYLSPEIGYVGTDNSGKVNCNEILDSCSGKINFDVDVTYVPVELNLRYAIGFAEKWAFGFGIGGSFNYFEVKIDPKGFGSESEDDWVWGGQVFADLTHNFGSWFLGLNFKYQFTEDLEFNDYDTDTDATNWRIGPRVGFFF
jgi:hypothetical protein